MRLAYEIVDGCDSLVRIIVNTRTAHPPKTTAKINHMDRIGIMLGVTVVLTLLMCWLIPVPTL